MCLEDKRIEFEAETDTGAGGDSRRRTRIGDRTGMRHRRGQGIRHGVRADPRERRRVSKVWDVEAPPARLPTWPIN
ncbi:putative transposase [Mycobacterium kansasii]|uniref:Putative transposase n=1 Tax=Mycobacterium kansasii TaxID=1768 RepID=A0A1V3WV79_MYCKA|nr:putative transposase [Mycobacterium kansasii]